MDFKTRKTGIFGALLSLAFIAVLQSGAFATATVYPASAHSSPWIQARPELVQMERKLLLTLRARGIPAAMSELVQVAASDQAVRTEAHMLSHTLGMNFANFYATPQEAFRACSFEFQSGCYHGVIETYLEELPELSPTAIKEVCPKVFNISKDVTGIQFQCYHAEGHALMWLANHDLPTTLAQCDFIEGTEHQQWCYLAAFMENAVHAEEQDIVKRGAVSADSHTAHASFLKSDDLSYPCNVAAARYQEACWVLQPAVVLHFKPGDYEAVTAVCLTAPIDARTACFTGLGREATMFKWQETSTLTKTCEALLELYQKGCYYGAVANIIDQHASPLDGLPLCVMATLPTAKNACYGTLSELTRGYITDARERERICAQVEPAYIAFCKERALRP